MRTLKRSVAAAAALCLVLPLFGVEPAGLRWDDKDGKYVAEAAELLKRCLRKATGTAPLLQAEQGKPRIRLEVRRDPKADPESFRIEFPAPDQAVIIGASPLAVRHGACEFLERFYGVRWLFPGEEGEAVPETRTPPVFPDRPVVMEPVYRMRTFAFDHKMKPHYEWAARNRGIFSRDFKTLRDRPWFQHNLWRLLPPERYTASNPEFFPVRKEGGPRVMPEKGYNIYWQYCFTAPGIRDAFVKEIQAYFQKHPDEYSVSLGVNDGGCFCRCGRCLKTDGDLGKDPMGHEIRSRSYLECMEEVARRCQAPGRSFGFLAYHSLRTPPPNWRCSTPLVPFLTYEKTYWADPRLKAEDQKLTSEWRRACGSVGWYDYLAHRDFLIPKISLKVLPEALKWGAGNGVRCYYAEAYPANSWHTGPMLWMILKLTWDPSLSADALLKDWCVAAVGRDAAAPLEQYYRACSEYWEKLVPGTEDFRLRRQYLPLGSSGYLRPVTSAWLDARRKELDEVVKLASPAGKARAEMIRQGFLKREPKIRAFIRNEELRRQLPKLNFRVAAKFDFDRKIGGTTWQRKVSKGTFFHAPGEGAEHSGAAAMDLAGSFKGMAYLWSLKVKPGFVYRVTAKTRSAGIGPEGVAGLRVAWSAPGKTWLGSEYNMEEKLNGDSADWRKLSVLVAAPTVDGCRMKIVLGARSDKGKVFFDDLVVEEAPPADGSEESRRIIEKAAAAEAAAAAAAKKAPQNEARQQELRRLFETRRSSVVKKFDFEQKIGGTTWQRKNSRGLFFHDRIEGIGHSGAAAVDLRGSFKEMTFLRNIKVAPGRMYRVTVFARCAGVDPSCIVGVAASCSGPERSSAPDCAAALRQEGDGGADWRRLEVVVVAPEWEECTLKISMFAGNSSKGKVFFDDLTVEEAPAEGAGK